MKITVLQAPYDSGHHARRMGRGPLHLVEQGLVERLQGGGHEVEVRCLELADGFLTEVGTAAELQRRLAVEVAEARRQGRFPLVLAGNCQTAAGTLAGLDPMATGVVWLDAHGDFNTPDISASGFFDGMALALVCGRCWQGVAETIPGFSEVPEQNVLLVGARDLDEMEAQLLDDSEIALLSVETLRRGGRAAIERGLETLTRHTEQIYLHLDLDVLDPSEAVVNPFQAPDGLSLSEALELVATTGESSPLAGMALTAYVPDLDVDHRALSAASALIQAAVDQAAKTRRA